MAKCSGTTFADMALVGERFIGNNNKFLDGTPRAHHVYIEGDNNEIHADNCLVIGNGNVVHGNDNIVSGKRNKVNGNSNRVFGDDNNCTGDDNNLMGHNSHALGSRNKTSGLDMSFTSDGVIDGNAVAFKKASESWTLRVKIAKEVANDPFARFNTADR